MSAFAISKLVSPRRLHESIANATLVLGEQHAAKLGEILRWVVEGAKHLLAFGDRQREIFVSRS
jgi:hypothetical protein